MDEPRHVVVLGAGVCGLYAARVLSRAGVRVTVLEREAVVGGLAAGHLRGGNYYDLGVHHLHEFDREIFEDLSNLMGDRLLAVEKSAKIRYGKGYRSYPLELFDLLFGIPPLTLVRALTGLVVQQVRNAVSPFEAQSAEDALIQLYGRPLYTFFFRDFTHRYWGVPPRELSAAFVRRKMPRLSAVDIIKKALSRFGVREDRGAAVESAIADETLHYARSGSRELPMAIAEAIRGAGGAVITDGEVVALETKRGRVVAVRYRCGEGAERLSCDACISTIPLPRLLEVLDPPPPRGILAAGAELAYRPLAVYGLLVRRPRVLDALYVYYRDRVFHRVAEPKNSGMQVVPEGHSVLLVETTCGVGDDRWNGGEATRREIVRDLEAEGLLRGADIAEIHLLRTAYGYPIFRLGFEPHFDAVVEHLETFANLRSTGRQGGFCYPNMHGAMRLGADAAEALLAHDSSRADEWRPPPVDRRGLSLSDGDMTEVAAAGDGSSEGATTRVREREG